MTRLERPPGVDALELDEQAATVLEERLKAKAAAGANDGVGHDATEWYDPGARLARMDGKARTSWLTEGDGRLPYTPAGRKAFGAAFAAVVAPSEGPEARTASDRCLAPGWSAAGPPILNPPASAAYRIAQSADEVVIVAEVNHELRRIRLDRSPGAEAAPRWGGTSLGRWEGETLVVETSGFNLAESLRPPLFYMSPRAHVTERFTRVSPREIRYGFTVEDPETFIRPWRGEEPFLASSGRTYEYACHEGNYSMAGILAGARRAEAEAARAGAVAGR